MKSPGRPSPAHPVCKHWCQCHPVAKGCFWTHQVHLAPARAHQPRKMETRGPMGWPSGLLHPPQDEGLAQTRGHCCIAGLQHEEEEKSSSLSLPCLDVTGASGSCSANPVGAFPAGTAEGPGGSAPAVTCPWPVLGRREGGGSCLRARGARSRPRGEK